jgi:hypothetical protein
MAGKVKMEPIAPAARHPPTLKHNFNQLILAMRKSMQFSNLKIKVFNCGSTQSGSKSGLTYFDHLLIILCLT